MIANARVSPQHKRVSRSKGVPYSEDDAATSAIRGPLIQEICRRECCVGDCEVSCIRGVIKFRPELKHVRFGKSRVLDISKIEIRHRRRPQNVAAHISERTCGGYERRQAYSARLVD